MPSWKISQSQTYREQLKRKDVSEESQSQVLAPLKEECFVYRVADFSLNVPCPTFLVVQEVD